MRHLTVLALLVLILASAACGGGTHQASLGGEPTAPIQVTPARLDLLPELPTGDQFNPQRVSSMSQGTILGAAALSYGASSIAGNSIELDSQAGSVAYALFDFPGVPGEAIEQFGFQGTPGTPGVEVYGAISNYTTGRWEFFAAQTGMPAFVLDPTPGKYVSPSGHTYILAATFDSSFYTLDKVIVDFSARFSVFGQVRDEALNPIPGAIVGSPLGQQSAVTDATGSYQLALPDGTWPVMVTLDSYTFYSNPSMVTVAGADVSAVDFIGRQHASHFLPDDNGPYNNTINSPEPIDLSAGPFSASLSRLDDASDFYRFSVPAVGQYAIEFKNPDMDVYFPFLQIWTPEGAYVTSGSFPLRGTFRAAFPVGLAPRDYMVSVSCSGNGGQYSISLVAGPSVELSGFVQDAATDGLVGSLVTLHNSVTNEDTEYLAQNAGFGGGFFGDIYRDPVSTTVNATAAGIFFPPSTTYDLTLGPETNALCVGVPTVMGDAKEPNNMQFDADTNAVLPLTYDSVGAGDALSVGGADGADYYRLNVPAGKGLRVRVDNVLNGGFEQPLVVSLLDNFMTQVPFTRGFDTSGMEIRLATPAGATQTYLEIYSGGGGARVFGYNLTVETYDPFEVNYSALFGANPIAGAKITLHGNGGLDFGTIYTNDLAPVTGLLAKDGENLLAEFFRFGFDNHRSTIETVVNGAPVPVVFAADPNQSYDSNEPNDNLFAPAVLGVLPQSVSATVDPDIDFLDHFKFTTTDANPLRIDFSQSSSQQDYFIDLFDGGGGYLSSAAVKVGMGPAFLATTGAGDYTIRVSSAGAPALYTLELDTAAAYTLSGSVQYMGAGLFDTVIYCPELDVSQFCDPATGAYSFGTVPPGTYTLVPYRVAYDPDQLSKQGVVTNAAVVVNFTLNLNPGDVNEPTDDMKVGATGPLVSGVAEPEHSMGVMGDTLDWYKFNATAGQLCYIEVSRAQPYYPTLFFDVEDSVGTYLGGAFGMFGIDNVGFTFIAPANDTYFFRVSGSTTGYTARVDLN